MHCIHLSLFLCHFCYNVFKPQFLHLKKMRLLHPKSSLLKLQHYMSFWLSSLLLTISRDKKTFSAYFYHCFWKDLLLELEHLVLWIITSNSFYKLQILAHKAETVLFGEYGHFKSSWCFLCCTNAQSQCFKSCLMKYLCSFGSQKCNLLKALMSLCLNLSWTLYYQTTLAQEAFCLESWCVHFLMTRLWLTPVG